MPFVVLASNDAFLGANHTRGEQALSWAGLLWRSILHISHSCQTFEHLGARLAIEVNRLVLVILGVEQQGFQAEGLSFEPTILDVVVRGGVVHEVLN